MKRVKNCGLGLIAILIFGSNQVALAQDRSGTVGGRVLDANNSAPLLGASVVLEPSPGGIIMSTSRVSPFLRASRTAVTDEKGAYRFDDLVPGTYRLLVRRLGYRPQQVDVDVAQSALRLSVGLEIIPVQLERVESQQAPEEPFSRAAELDIGAQWERVTLEQYRQAAFLSGDTRGITQSDVQEVGSVGESDIFRTLRSIPGVSFRDALSAELRTRGASWDQTRVTFDGLPLYNPVHLYGAFSSVNTDILGSAFYHPGARPVNTGDGAAGVLQLKSRSGRDDKMDGVAELGLFSARLAMDGTAFGGATSWVLAGRMSVADIVAGSALDYTLRDVTGRIDQNVGRRGVLSVSGMSATDVFSNRARLIDSRSSPSDSALFSPRRFGWGNDLGRAGYLHSFGSSELEMSVGVSRFWGLQDSRSWGVPTENEIKHVLVRGELRPTGIQLANSYSIGYEVTDQSIDHTGAAPSFFRQPLSYDSIGFSNQLTRVGGWVQKRMAFASDLIVEAGLKAEVGGKFLNTSSVRFAPHLVARFLLPERRTTISVTFGRAFQYAQTIGTVGPGPTGGDLNPLHVWVLAGDSLPALVSDLWSMTVERWLDGGVLIGASVYSRETGGVGIRPPQPGPVSGREGPVFGATISRGLELSARKLSGRLTGSLAYTFSRSRTLFEGFEFASDNDRAHVFSLTGSLRVSRSLTLGITSNIASGTPFTRLTPNVLVCNTEFPCVIENPVVGAPNDRRAPWFSTINLLIDWTHSYRTWDLGIYFRLTNVLNQNNKSVYNISGPRTIVEDGIVRGSSRQLQDHFEDGLPILPIIGFRAAF